MADSASEAALVDATNVPRCTTRHVITAASSVRCLFALLVSVPCIATIALVKTATAEVILSAKIVATNLSKSAACILLLAAAAAKSAKCPFCLRADAQHTATTVFTTTAAIFRLMVRRATNAQSARSMIVSLLTRAVLEALTTRQILPHSTPRLISSSAY